MPRLEQVCPFHAAEQPADFVGGGTIEWELTCHRTDHPVAGHDVRPATGEASANSFGAVGLDLGLPLAAAVSPATAACRPGTSPLVRLTADHAHSSAATTLETANARRRAAAVRR